MGSYWERTSALAGEVRVNLGGEPERDDSGLPPVDIEIPDDARELDRDVQAYYRELRARRRRQRRLRLYGPLGRDGVVLPLFAACLVVALIAGTLLTVFAPRSDFPISAPGTRSSSSASSSASASASASSAAGATPVSPVSGRLPAAAIAVGHDQVQLRALRSSVLALVPARCACTAAVSALAGQAASARVPLYLVAAPAGLAQVQKIAAAADHRYVRAAEDARNVLGRAYGQSGLTAVLVGPDGSLSKAADLPPDLRLTGALSALAPAASPAAG
jgi:hypothetical protein